MKKILIFILIFTMVFSLSVNCFAYDERMTDDIKKAAQTTFNSQSEFTYGTIYYLEPNDNYFLLLSTTHTYCDVNLENIKYLDSGKVNRYLYNKQTKTFDLETTFNVQANQQAVPIEYVVVINYELFVQDEGWDYGVENGLYDSTFFEKPKSLFDTVLGTSNVVLKDSFTPTFNDTALTLVLVGVGCLALLVVLKLFGKRSLLIRK